MKTVLKNFINQSLYDACGELLNHLQIKFSPQTKQPINFENLFFSTTSQVLPKQLSEVLGKVKETFFIGAIDEESLKGNFSIYNLENPVDSKYQTIMVFAVDIKNNYNLTRTEIATLTRGFNRMANSVPVILFVKNGNRLSLATCERSEYRQEWRVGEKLGKVSILRDINLVDPHRGHRDILKTLGDKAYSTFDELYKHWLAVFSSELLTKKFYTELSEWYAWVISSGKVKFPNNFNTTEDDTKYNHEAVIRLITRLIFVWFLKQKKLIPEEFFNENAIRENFIENFDPHSTNTLFYNPEESKYYRLILQNLFFAMLNRPIKDEETGNDENRRFVTDKRYRGISTDFNINNLLRYKSEFKEGGADKLLELANSQVPFLNGGLFECLDHKDKEDPEYGMYYDGFTENSVARKQLSFPDYFFFGPEEGTDVDLFEWYDDRRKRHVKVRSLIDLLNRYQFTVEENTPLDQEVSLDPELLGKVFENLLASYNPETKTSARKQTGSFYTPREIVQYMVDESLMTYLERVCATVSKKIIHDLFDYSKESIDVREEERKTLISALYNCKVLDPACGSGAFPMGILQQMVHALRKLDPQNIIWKEFILKISLQKDEEAYKIKAKKERNKIRDDIEEAFDTDINDPDYARKLYLIENCIFGIDIQPIAVQISKLRFFISLVSEQKPSNNPTLNFGIRPLPNLEAKFIAANTLMPLDKLGNLMSSADNLRVFREKLSHYNHQLFRAKHNSVKRELRNNITETRKQYATELQASGSYGDKSAEMIAQWNMFDQNVSAQFFDAQWMFDVEKGFDIVIANPPFVEAKKLKNVVAPFRDKYNLSSGTADLSIYFFEAAFNNLVPEGVLSFITTNKFFSTNYGKKLRQHLVNNQINKIVNFEQVEVFENVLVSSVIVEAVKARAPKEHEFTYEKFYQLNYTDFRKQFVARIGTFGTYYQKHLNEKEWSFADQNGLALKAKLERGSTPLVSIDGVNIYRGITTGYNLAFLINNETRKSLIKKNDALNEIIKKMLQGRNVRKWYYIPTSEYLIQTGYDIDIPSLFPEIMAHFDSFKSNMISRSDQGQNWYNLRACKYYPNFEYDEKIIWGLTADKWAFALDTEKHYLPSNGYILTSDIISTKYILGMLNSKLMHHYFGYIGIMTAGGAYTLKAATIEALPFRTAENQDFIIDKVSQILNIKAENNDADVSELENEIDKFVYHLYELAYEEIFLIDPQTAISKEEYENFKI